MKKHVLAAGIASTIGLAGLAGVGIVSAAETTSSSNPMSGLVSAIASKFNLNKDDVQKVFDEQHQAMEQERNNEVKNEIAQLVKDGKLTQDQADKLLAKRTELEKEREANRTNNQRPSKDDLDKKRTEFETWAKDNGIDTSYLRYVMGHGGRGGHGGPEGRDQGTDSTNKSSTSTNN